MATIMQIAKLQAKTHTQTSCFAKSCVFVPVDLSISMTFTSLAQYNHRIHLLLITWTSHILPCKYFMGPIVTIFRNIFHSILGIHAPLISSLYNKLIPQPFCRNSYLVDNMRCSLLWRHNGHDGVSNHQPHDFLLNRSIRPGDRWIPRTNGQ